MKYNENSYEIVRENGGWTIFIKFTGDVFQDGFETKNEAIGFLRETFG